VTMKRTFYNGGWKCLPNILLGVAKSQPQFSHGTGKSLQTSIVTVVRKEIRSRLPKHTIYIRKFVCSNQHSWKYDNYCIYLTLMCPNTDIRYKCT
jgi:hypothetical protein